MKVYEIYREMSDRLQELVENTVNVAQMGGDTHNMLEYMQGFKDAKDLVCLIMMDDYERAREGGED